MSCSTGRDNSLQHCLADVCGVESVYMCVCVGGGHGVGVPLRADGVGGG